MTENALPDDITVAADLVGWRDRGLHAIDADSMPWQPPFQRDSNPSGRAMTDADHAGVLEKQLVAPDNDDRPLVSMFRFPPGFSFPPHWHTEGEFILILAGSARFGPRELHTGDMVYADARCLYGAESAGPQGCDFLLVRRGPSQTTIVD